MLERRARASWRRARGAALLGVWILAGLSSGCDRRPASKDSQDISQASKQLENVQATVRHFPIDADSFVLVDSMGTRYVPDDLPEPFRSDGVRVVFTARRTDPPPNVRLVGLPIKLLRIARLGGRAS